MRDMGHNYHNTTEELVNSFEGTLQQVQELNREFQDRLQDLVRRADSSNTNQIRTTRQRFDQMIGEITRRNDQLQSIRRKCETVTSVVSLLNPLNWGRRRKKSCFGRQIPNFDPTIVTNISIGDSNVQDTLGEILDATDPNSNGTKFTLDGKVKVAIFSFNWISNFNINLRIMYEVGITKQIYKVEI